VKQVLEQYYLSRTTSYGATLADKMLALNDACAVLLITR